MTQKTNILFNYLCIIILAIGVILRCYIFGQNYSPYGDEIGLYNNIKNFGFENISFSDVQVAPILFILISKIIYILSGEEYIGLKIFPLICSIFSLLLFYTLSKQYLNNKISILFANILYSLNFSLIFYSQSIKHYSCEVLITIIIFILFSKININKIEKKQTIIYSSVFAIMLLFSFGISHIILAFLLVFIFTKEKNLKEKFYKIILLLIPLFIILSIYYLLLKDIYFTQVSEFKTLNYFNPYSYSWFANYFIFDFHNKLYPYLFTIMLIIGCYNFFRQDKKKLILLTTPILIAFILGQLYIYPFFGRMTLFLFPLFFILLAKELDYLKDTKIITKRILIILAILTLVSGKTFLIKEKLPYLISTSKEFYECLFENKLKKDEYLFINDQTYEGFIYYYPKYNNTFVPEDIITKKNMLIFYHDVINPFDVIIFPKNKIIHLFIAHYLWVDTPYYNSMTKWVNLYCEPIAKKEFKTGTYYKCINKKGIE